ncbi:Lysophosphatidic acid:oleoyl-CoA acyltransferase 1 [Parahypoxylon ruwenzoriense]
MEKYSQFRDRGSGISPFIPSSTPASSSLYALVHAALFLFRLPLFVSYCAFFFLVLDHLPMPQVVRKLLLWTMLGIPGIWWVDLQLDGVKRGSLSQQPSSRVPGSRSLIAAQFTSPIDALYLAAIFDPIFTVSYPGTRKVQRVSLLRAILLALSPPAHAPPSPPTNLTTLRALVEQNPHRVIAVFPEMSTTNGKGILPFSPSLLSAPADSRIFPVSIRYTPPDITTPVPGAYRSFLWNLLRRPTHLIRVRIAEGVTSGNNIVSSVTDQPSDEEEDDGAHLTPEEQALLDRIADTLARLARNKRVGLTLGDKAAFVEAWNKSKK